MSRKNLALLLVIAAGLISTSARAGQQTGQSTAGGAVIVLTSSSLRPRGLTLDGFFYETDAGRVLLPAALTGGVRTIGGGRWSGEIRMPDGRTIRLTVSQQSGAFTVAFTATPRDGVLKWGLALEALPDEYYTGLMERVVDGPQQASWAPGINTAMDLRGQKVEMLVKPTLSLYAPFYLSSRGYSVFVKGTWPGLVDFAQARPDRVGVEFEGPSFELKISTASNPAALVRGHAMEVGPPVLPPKWIYRPWRWRDEHTQRATYYDGTPVTGPFNSEVMEDVLMMQAFGIPNGVHWIDRPWGPGQIGYDDFEIDERRLPHFAEMTRWLDELQMKTLLWIGPFFKGRMETEAIEKGYGIPGQSGPRGGQNYPLAV